MFPLRLSLFALIFLAVLGLSQEAEAEREYPNEWTHRPLIEDFTSLSCSYCMSYNAQAIDQLVEDLVNDTSNPYNIVSFRQTNGGEGDDPFHTQDSRSRMRDHYGHTGTPNVQFDGNYRYVGGGGESNYQDYVSAIEDSGQREGEGNEEPFKMVDLDIYSEFIADTDGNALLEITVNIHYRGTANSDSGDDLDGELYVFIVEDGVPAYSSYLDEIWTNRMVFRDYAFEGEEVSLAEGESFQISTIWEIPNMQIDGDDISGDIKIPINPGRMIPIAVVFDRGDRDSGNDQDSNGDDTYPTPRAIQSATPKSTAYDNDLRNSDIINTQLTQHDKDDINIEVVFSDNVEISSAFLIYRLDNGPWLYSSMDISDSNQVAEAQILANGKVLTYHILSHNADENFNVSQAYWYEILYSNLNVQHQESAERILVSATVWNSIETLDIEWTLGVVGVYSDNQGYTADFDYIEALQNGSYRVSFYWYYNEDGALSDTYSFFIQLKNVQGNAWKVFFEEELYLVIHGYEIDNVISPGNIQINNQTESLEVDAAKSLSINITVSAEGDTLVTYNPIPVTVFLIFENNETILNEAIVFAKPGNSVSISFNHTFDNYGENIVKVIVDKNNLVAESNENNNVAEFILTVGSNPTKGCMNSTAINYISWAEIEDKCIFGPNAMAGQNATGTPGVPLQFSGAGTDEDGTIAKYEWDFDGDGIFEWSSFENGLTTYIYNNEGTFSATLRVTDNDGFTDTESLTVTIKSPDEDDEGLPGFGLAAAILSVGLIARTRRD